MKIYISGPVTGYPEGNLPAFAKAKEALTKQGFEALSPFDGETAESTAETLKDHYGDEYWKVLAKDVLMASGADAIAFLSGWERSKGARLEAYVGLLAGHKFFEFNGTSLGAELDPSLVAGVVAAQWMPREVKVMANVENTPKIVYEGLTNGETVQIAT